MPPTPYIPSIVIDSVIAALAAFIQPFASGVEIVRSQGNRVPPPPGAYIELTELTIVDIETPISIQVPANSQTNITGPARIDVQVDFYGLSAGDQCKAVKGVYRSAYAPAQFPDGIKPLYCDDGHQRPLVTGEEQYLTRWTLTASLQYNPVVSIPSQFASALSVALIKELS
jgi:hypothetical protein